MIVANTLVYCWMKFFIWWFEQSCHLSFWYYIILLWKDWVNISNSWIGISDNTWGALIFWGFDFRWNPNSNTVKLANYDSPFKSPQQGGLRIIKCFCNCLQFLFVKNILSLYNFQDQIGLCWGILKGLAELS